jgi:hypothetical protein
VLGTEGDKSKAEHMLKSAAGFIQRQVARVLDVRRMPHLRWVYDGSMEVASNMDKLIREARERDRAINPSLAAGTAEASLTTSASARASEHAVDESADADDLDEESDEEIDEHAGEDSGDDTDAPHATDDPKATEEEF